VSVAVVELAMATRSDPVNWPRHEAGIAAPWLCTRLPLYSPPPCVANSAAVKPAKCAKSSAAVLPSRS
jgi:hypothetical protein